MLITSMLLLVWIIGFTLIHKRISRKEIREGYTKSEKELDLWIAKGGIIYGAILYIIILILDYV